MNKRAYAYLRVSGPGQADDAKDGYPRQRAAIKRYAKAQGIKIEDEFRDAITGTTLDRPDLHRLFVKLAGDGVRLVLVENPDRLFRDTLVGLLLLEEFGKLGVQVVAADSGTDLVIDGSKDPTAKLIRTLMAAVAEFAKTQTVIRLTLGRARKRAKGGKAEGRYPFGTRPGETDTLARMRKLYRKPKGRDRMSYAAIAKVLNDEGYSTRQGGPWQAATVRGIVLRHGH